MVDLFSRKSHGSSINILKLSALNVRRLYETLVNTKTTQKIDTSIIIKCTLVSFFMNWYNDTSGPTYGKGPLIRITLKRAVISLVLYSLLCVNKKINN